MAKPRSNGLLSFSLQIAHATYIERPQRGIHTEVVSDRLAALSVTEDTVATVNDLNFALLSEASVW